MAKCVLIAHGSDVETVGAREIIRRTNPDVLEEHQPAYVQTEACAAEVQVIGGFSTAPWTCNQTLATATLPLRAYLS
jgi:hypothetical protein